MAAALSPAVVTAVVSILKLLIPPNTALKSHYRSNGSEKREGASNSDNNNVPALSGGLFTEGFYKYSSSGNVPASSRGLFTEGFYKYSSGGNIFNAIKGATRLAYLFLVVGIAILGSRGELTPRAVKFYKYYNIS